MDRKTRQDAFIRICRDSGFKMGHIKAAKFTADLLRVSPLEIWTAFAGLDQMEAIAAGKHPVCAESP